MQVEFAEAEIEHRRDRLGRYAPSVVCGIDDVADLHALIADMAVMIGDHAEATIGLGIGHGPEPLVGRGAIDAPAYGAVGFQSASYGPDGSRSASRTTIWLRCSVASTTVRVTPPPG